ncbi:MAG: DegT/DnrJ/EryC1/StrS family aminotransferase [Bacteroidetes bacterium]|nr:DegT/DnrJ/EryC1/StrS family aminotransferase [Bacteroidota bacterium]
MIPVNTPLLNGNEKKYLNECIDTGWISSEGPFIKRFEEEMASYVGRKFGVAVSNGSAALDIAVRALGIKEGDEVIMPTFTIISPAQSVVYAGGKPVLVDADAQTWCMDVKQIEAKITPKTRAIIVVHIYGFPTDMDPVIALANKYKLQIIEDAAEMHGQTYKGRRCGSFGHISIFSFYPNKHITTGEGGMIMTDDETLAEKCKYYRNLCFKPERRFVHEELGWNYRMTNLQAALGVAQLEKIESHILRKREIGALYNLYLQNVSGIELMPVNTSFAENIYWVYTVVSKNKTAIELMKLLGEKGIGTRPFFYPMHLQPVFQKKGWFISEHYPVAERIAEYGFYLPSGLGITDEEIKTVSQVLKFILIV